MVGFHQCVDFDADSLWRPSPPETGEHIFMRLPFRVMVG